MTFGTIARCLGDTEHGITAVKMPSLMSLATKILRTLFILYIILCALLYTFEPYLWILRLRLWPPEKSNSTKHGCSDAADIPHTRYHTGFKLGSTTIYGYPQKGGLYALPHALGVDFDFLGLDRFGSIGSKDEEIAPSDEEEVFCNKMRQLGARWWPDWGLYHRHSRRTVSHDGALYIGWPSSGGGVWVLHIDPMDMHFEKKPWGIIYNALSMDERCQIIEKLGGKFYPDPKTCPFHESLFTQKVRGEVDESAK